MANTDQRLKTQPELLARLKLLEDKIDAHRQIEHPANLPKWQAKLHDLQAREEAIRARLRYMRSN
jgi:hypothetical protein